MSDRLYLRACSDTQGKHCGKAFRSVNKRATLCPKCRSEREVERRRKERERVRAMTGTKAAQAAEEAAVRAHVEALDMVEADLHYEVKSLTVRLLRGGFIWGMS